jgi:hypothetical protein
MQLSVRHILQETFYFRPLTPRRFSFLSTLRWKKIPSLLRSTVFAVDLSTCLPGPFSVQWEDRNSKGEIDFTSPDSLNIFHSDPSFECPSEISLEKTHGYVCPETKDHDHPAVPDLSQTIRARIEIDIDRFSRSPNVQFSLKD